VWVKAIGPRPVGVAESIVRLEREDHMVIHQSLLLLGLASIVTACGGSDPKPVSPTSSKLTSSSDIQVTARAKVPPKDEVASGYIAVALEIRKACGLADDEAHFAYDSARVVVKDRNMLHALADCFVSGPLKGRQMSLVGHADSRGDGDYNLALGGRRADNVKEIIVAESMIDSRVSTTSRGEMDAMGTDEASWARDRYVDVELGQ
jgi:peptidoglycan-associated lipoprotein